ncbi:MAG: nicotinate (nicotinamide) nucleotide adenylyltransferase [Rikenellaceae bacterium]
MRVALLMGSFNPIHKGHTLLAQHILAEGLVDRVWLVVTPHNPTKSQASLVDFDHRVEMARLATASIEGVEVSTIEDELPRPSYTYHTICELLRRYPHIRFTILAGSDIAHQIKDWYRADELQSMVQFLYYPRKEGSFVASSQLQNAPVMDVSSTKLRSAEAMDLIDERVKEYIFNHNLYPQMKTIGYYTEQLERKPTADHYYERGKLHYAHNDFGRAINDFNSALELDPSHSSARKMVQMTNSILDFRHFDIYNP